MDVELSSKIKILLVQRSDQLREAVSLQLAKLGFSLFFSEHSDQAKQMLTTHPMDLVVLDLPRGCTKMFGFLSELTHPKQILQVPVVVISNDRDVASKIRALQTGADDYLCKPFPIAELGARIIAVLRRTKKKNPNYLPSADAREVAILKSLTQTEKKLFEYFLTRRNHLVRRNELKKTIWPNTQLSQKTVDAHLGNLRKKIHPAGFQIENVYGSGFALKENS
jgi:two-component system response regulator QseB